MSSLKPVIHGRDHLPGGADPIPVEPLKTNLFGNSLEEHLYVPSATVAAISSVTFDWTHYAGTTMMNLGTSGKAIVDTRGIYGVGASCQVFPPATEPAGDGIDIALIAVQAALGWPAATPSPSRATFVNPGNSSDTWYAEAHIPVALMDAADWFQIAVVNHNSYDVDVVIGIRVVRIIDLS